MLYKSFRLKNTSLHAMHRCYVCDVLKFKICFAFEPESTSKTEKIELYR